MIFKNLTFDGISLKEYGVYISGEAVFDSPTREVEMITIPGRNGSFALDKGRFNNITVTYPAGIYATNETEFAEKVSTLRNLLASRKGYCRLTDEYNPDEFRLGVYKAGLELDPTHYNEAGRFELSFDCKPQRFLFSGEEVFTLGEWGQTETKSGSIASFEGNETTAIKSLTAQIVPKQSGSGDPSPSNIRPISAWSEVNVTRCGKNLVNPSEIVDGKYMAVSGAELSNADRSHSGLIKVKPNTSYFMNGYAGNSFFAILALDENMNVLANYYGGASKNDVFVATMPNNARYVYLNFFTTQKSTMAFYEATSNEGYIAYQGTSYPISLGQTVYGGTLDVVSGELKIERVKEAINGTVLDAFATSGGINFVRGSVSQTSTQNTSKTITDKYRVSYNLADNSFVWLTGRYFRVYSNSFTDLASTKTLFNQNPLEVCYELATPTEIQLTPTEVKTLLGQNNIWADSGDVTVEIGQNPNVLVNPTLFEACPLIEFNASGSGEINLGSRQIKVLNSYIGNIPLNLSANDNEVTIVNTSSFNSGDIIKFNGASINIEYASNGQSWMPYVTARDGLNGTEYLSREGGWGITPKSTEMTFTAGTSSTVTQSLDVKVVRQHTTPATEETQTFTLSVAYDGTDKFTVTWTIPTYTVYPTYRTTDRSNYVGSVNSTKSSLEDVDIYVDLDIGEAYSIDSDDNVVSLNNFVNLGGELPTLEPGATEISTDSSISNVKVTPRWWKV